MQAFRPYMKKKEFFGQFAASQTITNCKKVKRNTFEYTIDGENRIRLYETDIMIFKEKSIILNTGGFYNNLTKDRINDFLPQGRIYKDEGKWYYTCNDTTIRFFDGIEINRFTGKLVNPEAAPYYADIDKENKATNKLIKAYCDKINKLDELPIDTDGDCFQCLGVLSNNDNEHLKFHLEEKYIMKSLILNALREDGYVNPSFTYHVNKTGKKKDVITRSVTRYFRKRFIKK